MKKRNNFEKKDEGKERRITSKIKKGKNFEKKMKKRKVNNKKGKEKRQYQER
jgi:hypothetical protein